MIVSDLKNTIDKFNLAKEEKWPRLFTVSNLLCSSFLGEKSISALICLTMVIKYSKRRENQSSRGKVHRQTLIKSLTGIKVKRIEKQEKQE